MPSRWSTSREQPTHCVACPGPIMKCLIKSWLRSANRSASVTFPSGASKIYSLSILTHGRARRSALSRSRRRVSSFSRLSRSFRATSQSVCDTISWSDTPSVFSIICVLIFCLPLLSSFFIRTTNERRHLGHLLAHFFGLRWQAQRDAALPATFAFAEYQSGDTSKFSACLSDLPLSREAEQRKAVWRCASHRTPKTLPLSKRRTPSLATDNLQHR